VARTVDAIAPIARRLHPVPKRLRVIFDSDHLGAHTLEHFIFPEALGVEFNIILEAFPILAIFLHQTRNVRAAVGGSDGGGFVRRCRVMVVVQMRGVACRQRLVL